MNIIEVLINFKLPISVLIFGIILIYCIKYIKKNIFDEYIRNMSIKEYLKKDINENLINILDRIIEEIFTEYRILNLEYRDIDYVNSEMEKNIVEDLTAITLYKISPQFLNRLHLIYDVSSQNKINDLITKRCYIRVLQYSIEKNKVK